MHKSRAAEQPQQFTATLNISATQQVAKHFKLAPKLLYCGTPVPSKAFGLPFGLECDINACVDVCGDTEYFVQTQIRTGVR